MIETRLDVDAVTCRELSLPHSIKQSQRGREVGVPDEHQGKRGKETNSFLLSKIFDFRLQSSVFDLVKIPHCLDVAIEKVSPSPQTHNVPLHSSLLVRNNAIVSIMKGHDHHVF